MKDLDILDKFDSRYRKLILDALEFISQNESYWNLDEPIDRYDFIAELIKKVIP